jgi:hypothetical protein
LRRKARGGEFDRGILYACAEVSQLNPFVQLIYANLKSDSDAGADGVRTTI